MVDHGQYWWIWANTGQDRLMMVNHGWKWSWQARISTYNEAALKNVMASQREQGSFPTTVRLSCTGQFRAGTFQGFSYDSPGWSDLACGHWWALETSSLLIVDFGASSTSALFLGGLNKGASFDDYCVLLQRDTVVIFGASTDRSLAKRLRNDSHRSPALGRNIWCVCACWIFDGQHCAPPGMVEQLKRRRSTTINDDQRRAIDKTPIATGCRVQHMKWNICHWRGVFIHSTNSSTNGGMVKRPCEKKQHSRKGQSFRMLRSGWTTNK